MKLSPLFLLVLAIAYILIINISTILIAYNVPEPDADTIIIENAKGNSIFFTFELDESQQKNNIIAYISVNKKTFFDNHASINCISTLTKPNKTILSKHFSLQKNNFHIKRSILQYYHYFNMKEELFLIIPMNGTYGFNLTCNGKDDKTFVESIDIRIIN